MVEIATYCCKDRTEARIKENEHYNELQASLNSCQPYVNKLNYLCSICNLQFTSVMKYNYHVDYCTKYYKKYCEKNNIGENNIGKNNIGKNNIEENNIGENNIEENDIGENNINEEICDNSYNCNLCNYSTNKKFNYDKHLVTLKHKINSKEIDDKKYYCEFCNKYFNSNNSLWKHNNRKHPPMNDEDKINKLTNLVVHVVEQNTYLSQQICQLAKRDTNNMNINGNNNKLTKNDKDEIILCLLKQNAELIKRR